MLAQYYIPFLQATHIVVDKLVQSDKSSKPEEVKRRDVQGILNLILPCHATLHMSFPIHRYNVYTSIVVTPFLGCGYMPRMWYMYVYVISIELSLFFAV